MRSKGGTAQTNLATKDSIALQSRSGESPDIEKRLDALAKKTGRTKSFYAREAILRHIEDIEDQQLASSRPKRGGGKSVKALERRKGASDADWLRSLSVGLSEWSSPEDAKAYDDL